MLALIDADIFQYEFGNSTDEEGKKLPWPFVQSRLQGRINRIVEEVNASEYTLFLTSDDKSNFRYNIATIKPYKGNRVNKEKPYYYDQIRNFLVDHRDAVEVRGMEADDALAIAQYKALKKCEETVICSRDKDLKMVPGWHYCWGAGKQEKREIWWQNEIDGLRCFYKQLLTGDSVDNIPGIYGLGKSSKSLADIDACDSELDMYRVVYKIYKDRFGSYAEQFLEENGRLLWMLEEEGQLWKAPILPESKEIII